MSPGRRGPPRPLTPERAWDHALWLLGRQAYSAAELERRLLRRQLAKPEAERVVARLRELGLLDDARYAESYVDARKRAKGTRALRVELHRKGVGEEEIEAALSEAGESDQLAVALDLLGRHSWRFADAAGEDLDVARRARARAAAFLARRGFAPDVVAEALSRTWPDEH